MVVINKLIFLIWSVIFISQNLHVVNTAQSVDQYESGIGSNFNNFEKPHAQHERVKREDDSGQGNEYCG